MLAGYEAYARNALVQLRRIREGSQIEEDHMRNRQLIVRWLIANTTAIDVRKRDGKTFYVLTDRAAFREGVGRLLAEVQRIKSTGDYEAARLLVETHGVHFDPALRDEVVARVERLDLPSYTGFVMPRLEPVRDESGRDHRHRHFLPDGLRRPDAGVLGEGPGGEAQGSAGLRARRASASQAGQRSRLIARMRQLITRASSPSHRSSPVPSRPPARGEPRRLASRASPSSRPRMRGPRRPINSCVLTTAAASASPLQAMAVRALGRLERPDLVTLLLPLIDAQAAAVRAEAANALAQSRGRGPGRGAGRP